MKIDRYHHTYGYDSISGIKRRNWGFLLTWLWRHTEREGVLNHPRLDCLFILSFRHRSKKTSRITCNGLELESQNLHQICILRFSWLIFNTGVIDHSLQGHLAISSQDSKYRHSTSFLDTDLGRPRSVTLPKVLLCIIKPLYMYNRARLYRHMDSLSDIPKLDDIYTNRFISCVYRYFIDTNGALLFPGIQEKSAQDRRLSAASHNAAEKYAVPCVMD